MSKSHRYTQWTLPSPRLRLRYPNSLRHIHRLGVAHWALVIYEMDNFYARAPLGRALWVWKVQDQGLGITSFHNFPQDLPISHWTQALCFEAMNSSLHLIRLHVRPPGLAPSTVLRSCCETRFVRAALRFSYILATGFLSTFRQVGTDVTGTEANTQQRIAAWKPRGARWEHLDKSIPFHESLVRLFPVGTVTLCIYNYIYNHIYIYNYVCIYIYIYNYIQYICGNWKWLPREFP